MFDRLLETCRNADTIYIYGAGTIADILYMYLKQNRLQHKVGAFVVTELGGNVSGKFGIQVAELPQMTGKLRKAAVLVAVQRFIRGEVEAALREKGIGNYHCVDSDKLLDGFYGALYREPICKNKVLFQNQSGMGYGGNPKYIAEKLLEQDAGNRLELVWAVSQYREAVPKRIRQVIYGSEEYYRDLATAKVWVDNSRKAYSVRKREGQFYVQAWHGAAPIKKVEKDVEDRLPAYYIEGAKNDSKMADVFLSGSRFYTELYRKSFWYDGVILKYGLPRHDVFWNMGRARRKIQKYYHIGEETGMVLYAPTFRDCPDRECYDLQIGRTVRALERKFLKPFRMLVSRHPVNYRPYAFEKGADYIDVGDYDDFQELLAAADILITDYSGCMYDFSFTKRPVFLYQRDFDAYLQDRNFYIPMEELPYAKAHSNGELEKAIESFNGEKYIAALDRFMESQGNYDTGEASEKVVGYLREKALDF